MTDGLSLHESFDEPFSEVVSTSVDDLSYEIALDGRPFRLDLMSEAFTRRSVQLLNTQQAQSGGDVALLTPEVWRRSIDSWHQGSGQSRYDRAESQAYRFHDSQGIDPWQKFGFELLPTTTVFKELTGGASARLCSIGQKLFIGSGTNVGYYANLAATVSNHTSPANVLDMVSDGENLYVLCANGVIEKRDSAGTWTTLLTIGSFDSTRAMIAYVKDFLVVGHKNVLYNATSGALVAVYTHPLTSYSWRAATDGQVAIYVLGGAGDRWNIHRVSVASTGASLDPPIVAATLPDGETAYALGTYLGYLLIGVHYGWRFATTDSSGEVTFGQVVQTSEPVRCFEGQDRFVWFGLSRSDSTARNGLATVHAGLGRADLSVFIDVLTPASATDLSSSGFGDVTSVVTVANTSGYGMGKRVFSVTGVGVFVESDNLETEGTISMGGLNFNSTDQKMGLYAQVFHDALAGGSVIVEASNDINAPTFVEAGRNSRVDSVSVGNVPYPRPFNVVELQIRLTRSATSATVGPRVSRVEFRAIDVPGRATEWRIPVMLTDLVENGSFMTRDLAADYDFLVSLVQSRREFIYREASRSYTLHATDFTWKPDQLVPDGSTYRGTFLLVAQELT